MRTLPTRLRRWLHGLHAEVGAVATEYGLMLMLIALVIVIAATAFGIAVSGLFDRGTDGFS